MQKQMRRTRHVALMSVLLLGVGCVREEVSVESAEEEEVRQELLQRIRAYEQALLNGDPIEVKAFWTEDAQVLLPGLVLEGDALASFVDEFYGSGGRVLSVEFRASDVFVHGGAAYELGRLEETARLGSQELEIVREHYFIRWERSTDRSWRIDRFLAGSAEAENDGE